MKIVNHPLTAVMLITSGLLVGGCSNDAAPEGSVAVPAATTPPATAAATPAASPEPGLDDVRQAYRDLTGLTDKMEVLYRTSRGESPFSYEVQFGGDDTVYLDLPDSKIVIGGGLFYMTLDSNPGKYLEVGAAETPFHSFLATTGSSMAPIQLALRYADDPADVIKALSSGRLPNPRVVSSGANEIVIEGDKGSCRVNLDPETGLVAAMRLEFVPENQDGSTWTVDTTITSEIRPDAPPVTFTPGDRYRVLSAAALGQVSEGEPAPDFTLETLAGETVTLSGLRGSVVVLDFWATWCGPCRRGLPNLEEFHRWAESSGKPIRVFAVDVWERHPTEEAKRAAVEKFWKESGFTMPTLLDFSGAGARPFGFRSIPTMVVVDPEGKIAKVHTGYDPGIVDKLKAETQILLGDA